MKLRNFVLLFIFYSTTTSSITFYTGDCKFPKKRPKLSGFVCKHGAGEYISGGRANIEPEPTGIPCRPLKMSRVKDVTRSAKKTKQPSNKRLNSLNEKYAINNYIEASKQQFHKELNIKIKEKTKKLKSTFDKIIYIPGGLNYEIMGKMSEADYLLLLRQRDEFIRNLSLAMGGIKFDVCFHEKREWSLDNVVNNCIKKAKLEDLCNTQSLSEQKKTYKKFSIIGESLGGLAAAKIASLPKYKKCISKVFFINTPLAKSEITDVFGLSNNEGQFLTQKSLMNFETELIKDDDDYWEYIDIFNINKSNPPKYYSNYIDFYKLDTKLKKLNKYPTSDETNELAEFILKERVSDLEDDIFCVIADKDGKIIYETDNVNKCVQEKFYLNKPGFSFGLDPEGEGYHYKIGCVYFWLPWGKFDN